jgi:5'-nucleotidase
MSRRLRILLTNDDGFSSPGIRHLYDVLKKEHTVTVVAPEQEKSGVGHAFTYNKPLKFQKREFKDGGEGYSVSGTPADCVKIALSHILDEKPDVIVSGMNNGNNTGIAAYYSGTVAAVREGAFWHVTSIAFSLCEKKPGFFSEYALISCKILQKIMIDNVLAGNDKRVFYNVNFPSCHPDKCAGVVMTKQSLSYYNDRYEQVKQEDGTVENWLCGERKDVEQSNEYDARAVENNYIAVTPLHIDATAFNVLGSLSGFEGII